MSTASVAEALAAEASVAEALAAEASVAEALAAEASVAESELSRTQSLPHRLVQLQSLPHRLAQLQSLPQIMRLDTPFQSPLAPTSSLYRGDCGAESNISSKSLFSCVHDIVGVLVCGYSVVITIVYRKIQFYLRTR
jgi:hypothetical protein